MRGRGTLITVHTLQAALDQLARVRPELVDDARSAWRELVDTDSPESLTQWRVQRFCWERLPATGTDPAARRRTALALAELLDGLGLPRYAAIARGGTTHEIVSQPDASSAATRSLVRSAYRRSGIEPPDTELITWAAVCGPAEAAAREGVADRLELAVAVGDLQPGARGWRDQQADAAIAVLLGASGDARPMYDAVLDERLEAWVRGPRSATRAALLGPLETVLREPVEPGSPRQARRLLAPLDWLVREVGDGLVLTAAGYLPPRTVARAVAELGWRDELGGPANREVDTYPVVVLREAATRLGLVRRRGNRLLLSPTGRDALADGRALWLTVAAGLVGAEHSATAVAWEVVLAALESGHAVVESEVRRLVQTVVTESGWRLAGRSEPAEADTSALFLSVLHELRRLGLVEETGGLLDRRVTARPAAQPLFRAALRHRLLHRSVVVA